MAEYIKREDAYTTLTDYYHHSTETQHMALKEALDRVPAASVRPVVRGRWIWQDAPCFGNPYGSYKCECGCLMPHKTNFCPNCGAQMIGGDDDV